MYSPKICVQFQKIAKELVVYNFYQLLNLMLMK